MKNTKSKNGRFSQSKEHSLSCLSKQVWKNISFFLEYILDNLYNNLIAYFTIFFSTIIVFIVVSFVSEKNLIAAIVVGVIEGKEINSDIVSFNIGFFFIVTALMGVFPASYLAYLFYRRERSQVERTKNDLKLLGLVTENELKNFDRLYATVYDPTQFLSFILLLIIISTIILTAYYNAKTSTGLNNLKLLSRAQAEIIFYAFLGAYLYGIRLIVRRYNTGDLQPQVYASIILRILMAGSIAFGLASFIDIKPTLNSPVPVSIPTPSPTSLSNPTTKAEDTSTEKANSSDGIFDEKRLLPWQVLAFLIGVFPDQGLRSLVMLGKRAFRDPTLNQFNERSLRKIIGINEWHQARLEELGIDDAQSLATADICRLLLTTQFDTMQVINWIDQAILHMKAGTKIEQFLAFQITTYHELYTLYTVLKKELGEIEASLQHSSSQGIQNFAQILQREEDKNDKLNLLDILQEINSHLKKAPDKPNKDEYEKLLVALGFLSLTELERLCDYSNYPNYVRIREYYKNLANVVHEQSRSGVQEIIRGFSRKIGGKVINLTSLTNGTSEESLTPQEITQREDKIRRLDFELQFGLPNAELYTEKGLLHYEIGELDEALDAYNQAVAIDPSFAGAYTGRSIVYRALGNRARDQEDLEKKQGNLAKQQQHDKEAQRYEEEAQRWYREAQHYYTKAINDNLVAIRTDPANANAFNHLGLVYMEQGDFFPALENLEIALKLNDRLAAAYYNRGAVRNTIAKSEKDFREAALDFERAYLLGYCPDALWATWGLALLNTGQYQQAVEKLTRAIALTNENPALYLARRGFAYLELGRTVDREGLGSFSDYAKQASRDFERAIELSGDLAIAYVHYGYLKTLERDYDRAIAYYKTAIKYELEDYTTYATLAELYLRRRQSKQEIMAKDETDACADYYEAIEYYKEAINRGDSRPETYFNRAVAYLELARTYDLFKDTDNAINAAKTCRDELEKYIEYYKKAINRGDSRPETYFSLAVAYFKLAEAYKLHGNTVNAKSFAQTCKEAVKKCKDVLLKTSESQYNHVEEEVQDLEDQIDEFLNGLSTN